MALDKLLRDKLLNEMLDKKNKTGEEVVAEIDDGLSVSTEGCTTQSQLQNKVARAMHDYINGERNTTPTKRQLDDMTIMLDESIVAKADWDDPKDVLAWIEESAKNLNDPEFARTVYKDNKTPAEVMVDMLKSHGYGEIRENQSETERIINAKISDLENYGFLASDLFEEDAVNLSDAQSMNESPTPVMETFTSEVAPTSFDTEEDEHVTDTQFMNEPPASVMETLTGEVEPTSFSTDEDDYRFFASNTDAFEDEFGGDEYEDEYVEEDSFEPPILAQPDPSMFTNNPTELESEDIQRQLEADEIEKAISETEPSFETMRTDEIKDDFFATRPKDAVNESAQDFEPFFQTKEKDSAETEIFTTKLKDSDTVEDEFFTEKSKDGENDNDFFQVKPKDTDMAELEAFQAKYGPTANAQEMRIVKHIEEELEELTERRQAIKEQLMEIQEELKTTSQVGPESAKIANIENKTNSDLAINEAREKIRLSTAVTRNNDAVVAFNEVVETHSVIDMIRTSNAIEALGNEHLLNATLTHALEEMAKTYYGKTINQLKEDLMEGSKALSEANQLLATNPDENVYEDQIASVREALKNIATDRSKEKIMYAVIQVGNLEEGNPYTPTIMNALDKISNLYYGKTAEEIKNQILNSSKACNEAQEEVQRLRLRMKENSVESITQSELDVHYATEALQKAVMNHSKENILEAAAYAQKINPKEPSRDAIIKALNSLAVTHLNKNLTELRWQDARTAIEEAQKSTSANSQEAIQRFNQATKSYTKADIIVALNMAKESESHELVSALNKMAVAYYGVDAEELTAQFRNYSKALSGVQDLISSNEIPQDAKENEAMPLFHKAVQSKSEEDIMNALDAVNNLPSYHPLKKPMIDALNAQLILVTREEPMTFEEPVVVNDNKNKIEIQKKATALLQEYQKVDSDIKKRQNDLNQYAKNKQKEKEELQEPPARVIDETTNTNPNLFKKACAGAKEALKQMSLKKVATTVVKAAAIGTAAYFAPIPLAIGYAGYRLLRNPEKVKEKKEKNKEARREKLKSIRDAFMLEDEEDLATVEEEQEWGPLEEEESVQQVDSIEQQLESEPSEQEIEFYKSEEDEWVRINSDEELIHEMVEGSIIGASINQGPIWEYANEEIANYLHNGKLEFLEEEVENKYDDVEVKRGR